MNASSYNYLTKASDLAAQSGTPPSFGIVSMDSPATNEPPTSAAANPGLPPVQPPSGRFIVQLFVVPGLLIAVVVLVVIGLSYLGRRDREPAYFLQQLDSDNEDIRKRGMSDLAQILKRREAAVLRWKADPR